MSSFKCNENIHKKEDGSYYVVSANKASSWPCNDPATKAGGNVLQFWELQIGSRFKDWYKSKWVLVWFLFYGPSTHFRSFQARSVNLATLFLGKPPRQFTSTYVYILSPVTDNCSSWISRRRRMDVEMFSWPSLHKRMCRTWGSNSGPLACQANTLPIELPCPANQNGVQIIKNMSNRQVWSESSQCAQWVAGDPMFLSADSEDSN